MSHPSANGSIPTATLRPACRELPPYRRRRIPKPVVIYPKSRYRRSERGERMLTVTTLSDGRELLR